MASLGNGLDRLGRLGSRRMPVLALAAAAALLLAVAADDLLSRKPLPVGRAAATPFVVEAPSGRRIGALSIDYPRRLRENQDGAVRVRYAAAGGWGPEWRAAAARWPDLALTVRLAAARLALEPAPAEYRFDKARVAAGGDGRSWIVSPEREGDYTLLVRLEAVPATFRAVAVAANGEALGRIEEVALPITVSTRYRVPQVAVDLARAAASLLAFLLTLPLAAALWTRLAGRRRRGRRGGETDGGSRT